MKPKVIVIGLAALTLLASSALVLTHRTATPETPPAPVQTYQVHGVVRALTPAEKTIRITHEAIPNYMPAMTMPFPVKDTRLLSGLQVGDQVQFELSVTTNDAWISHIEKIASASGASVAEAQQGPSLAQLEADRLQRGELVPDFPLTDQDGHRIHLKDFRGKAVVLTFIYTRCPLPNFCPLMSQNFAELEQRLSKEFPGRYHLLSISMDPQFDTPAVLKDYGARYDANAKDWSLAAADAGTLKFIAGLVGLYYQNENGLISHDLRTALIGPDGRLVQLWKSNYWTPYEVQRRVREVLTGHTDVATR